MNETNANLHILSRKLFFQIQRQSMKIVQILRYIPYYPYLLIRVRLRIETDTESEGSNRKK